jgi:hypothetical protein
MPRLSRTPVLVTRARSLETIFRAAENILYTRTLYARMRARSMRLLSGVVACCLRFANRLLHAACRLSVFDN